MNMFGIWYTLFIILITMSHFRFRQVIKGVGCSFLELKEPACFIIFVQQLILFSGYLVPYTFLPLKAAHEGCSGWEGAFLVSLISISDCFGRLFFGWVGHMLPKQVYHKSYL